MRLRQRVGLAKELGVRRRVLYNWRDQLDERDAPPYTVARTDVAQTNPQLKRLLANKTLEVDFFRHALQKVGARRLQEFQSWRQGIYDEIRTKMPLQGSLAVERMCQLAEVSRAGFYRYLRGGWKREEEAALRSTCRMLSLIIDGATDTGGSPQNFAPRDDCQPQTVADHAGGQSARGSTGLVSTQWAFSSCCTDLP